MTSLIGAHFSRNGIKQFPARVVLSMYSNGLGGDETHPDTITILRDTRIFPSGEAPPDFHTFDPVISGISWEQYGRYWYSERTEMTIQPNGTDGFRNFKDAWDIGQAADYYTICNEQGGGDGNTPAEKEEVRRNVQRLIDIERAIAYAANADGRKCCVGNFAGGSPGDFELWKELVAPFILEAWENGGNIYGRHCYADKFVNDDGSVVPGQPQRVIAELEYLRSIGYGGGMVLTECGLYGGYGVADYNYFEQQVTRWEAVLRPYSDILIGFCWWECGASGFEANYTEHLKKLTPYMNNSYLGKWEPAPPNEDDMEPKDCDLFLDLGRFVHLLPQDTTDDEIATIARQFNAAKNSFVYSHDDAELIIAHGRGENADGKKVSEVRIWEPERFTDDVIGYFASRGYKYSVGYFAGGPPIPPPAQINLKYRPCQTTVITQIFGSNPGNYDDFGLPGHEGMDYGVGSGGAFYAAADGIVVHASDRKWSSDTPSGYGWHVVLNHGDYCTVYAHARPDLIVGIGQFVTAGQVVGYSGNTGNSTGYHLHFGVLDKTGTVDPGNGYPVWTFGRPVNPAPFVTGKPAPALPQPTIDIAPYFVPAAQYGPKIVMQVGSGTQPMQLEKRSSDVILRKGDGNWIDGKKWQDSEQWRVKDGQIQKGKDTSDAGNGGRDGYDLGWAQWLPQFVSVGQTYHSTPTVKRFNRTLNCQVYSTSQANDYLYIKKIIPTWISPANVSIVLYDVLVVEWRSGTPDLSVPPNEVYYFAKGIGYVGWGSHFIVEIVQGQTPLTGALDCGM